jgi:hypothetical protein
MRKLIWMVWSWTAGALALAAFTPVQAQQPSATSPAGRSVELAVSDEALQLRYLSDASVVGRRDSDLGYGLLLTEERDVVASATLLLDTEVRLIPRLSIQFGPQAYVALLSEENEDAFALAFGVQARYDLVRSGGIAIVGNAFYSPDVLTFGTADNITDFEARAEMRLNQQLMGFVGYRWFEMDQLNREDRKLQNELFAGIRWQLR